MHKMYFNTVIEHVERPHAVVEFHRLQTLRCLLKVALLLVHLFTVSCLIPFTHFLQRFLSKRACSLLRCFQSSLHCRICLLSFFVFGCSAWIITKFHPTISCPPFHFIRCHVCVFISIRFLLQAAGNQHGQP